jgi:hypothetical protein
MGWRVTGSGGLGKLPHGGSHCQLVTESTQAADDAGRYVGKIRMLAKGLARMRVGEVYFHERQAYSEQGVPQRDAGVRERAWIEYQEADAGGGCPVDPADQLGFRIALERYQLVAGFAGQLPGALFDRLERVRSVNLRLTAAEQVQIGSV